MKKSRAFSLMEVIVSVFILFLVLIPSIKLNSQQLKTYSKIRVKEKELHSDFLSSFNDFKTYARNIQNDEFNLTIDVEDIEVDFSDRKEKVSLINLEYRGASKTYKNKIIKFKD